MTDTSFTARVRASLPGLVLFAFLPLASAAQEADFQEPVQESMQEAMDIKLVTLDVTVTGEDGAPLPDEAWLAKYRLTEAARMAGSVNLEAASQDLRRELRSLIAEAGASRVVFYAMGPLPSGTGAAGARSALPAPAPREGVPAGGERAAECRGAGGPLRRPGNRGRDRR